MSDYKQHQITLKEVHLKVQREIENIRLFPQHVGHFFSTRIAKILPIFVITQLQKFRIKIGIKGQSDLNGIIKINGIGVRIEVEIKTGNAVQTKEQKNWARMIENMGGIYILARDPAQAVKDIKIKVAEIKRRLINQPPS